MYCMTVDKMLSVPSFTIIYNLSLCVRTCMTYRGMIQVGVHSESVSEHGHF